MLKKHKLQETNKILDKGIVVQLNKEEEDINIIKNTLVSRNIQNNILKDVLNNNNNTYNYSYTHLFRSQLYVIKKESNDNCGIILKNKQVILNLKEHNEKIRYGKLFSSAFPKFLYKSTRVLLLNILLYKIIAYKV